MELRHLRYFRAVAEELHFGRAAQRLHIAQPPLSQQIRQLERELGVALLVRSTRRVELTSAGEDFLRRTVDILGAVDVAELHARRIADGVEGHLTIGCVGSATYSLLPRLVRVLREELPGLDVDLRGEMLAPAQVAALRAGEIDLAILRPPRDAGDLRLEVIRRDRLIVALPDSHRLASHDRIDIADLRDDNFIAHLGQGRSVMSDALTELCATAGFAPNVRHEVAETSTLITFVAAGLGVAVVPDPTSALDLAGVTYVPLSADAGMDLAAAQSNPADSAMIGQVLEILRRIA
ncbi:LysR substrate-binding domain-containing protein [Antrihabitans cavernicola]|uniref:LysR family transcriptional regulator n=1 Tax=Antrihabitans cavernicola TaxID=2495913 RepID=A0A5A7SH75_9NOCA|nr:LysR substrate-binding domain-containing protein [Spelaeibacter cavernicola]KAA0024749.1 LysR family transcriptional regulator [Spelaeibacter cavernicola]